MQPKAPKPSLTPSETLKHPLLSALLTPFEQSEILEFSHVYFVGSISQREKIAGLPHTANNNGYDDERGDYRLQLGDHLEYRYEALSVLGKGSFGQVVKCFDHKKDMLVALKVIRNKKRFHHQALVEVRILEHLMSVDKEHRSNIVRVHGYFYFRNHLCIAFEPLSINLYEFIKNNQFQGLSLGLIRRFAIQLLTSLAFLAQHRIIHCFSRDTRLLTDRGFLFRHEIESRWRQLRFACYDPDSRQLVYCHASGFVCRPRGNQRMIRFGCSDDSTDDVSLLVTEGHDMYVQRGSWTKGREDGSKSRIRWQADEGAERPYEKVKAAELLSTDPARIIRLLACASGGIRLEREETQSSLPFVAQLGLSSGSQVTAFLQLYGFWLGQESLKHRTHSSNTDGLCFDQTRTADRSWLCAQLDAVGLVASHTRVYSGPDGRELLLVLEQRWLTYFQAELSSFGREDGERPAGCRLMPWVLERLGRDSLRLLLDGFSRASGITISQRERTLLTLSASLRDELLVAALHAGYTARCVQHRLADGLLSSLPLPASATVWAVHYSAAEDESAAPCLQLSSAVRCDEYDGQVWCVQVPTGLLVAQRAVQDGQQQGGDSLFALSAGSRPVVVGNCDLKPEPQHPG